MKKLLLLVLFLNITKNVGAQKMPSDYFEEANNAFEEKAYEEALIGYLHIVEKHPKNPLFARALFNSGIIYSQQKNYRKAITVFQTMLAGKLNDREKLGGSIMDEPYANYKHRASLMMSNIYFEKEAFDTALSYFALADTIYPYQHFCGNEYAANAIYTALRYATIYQKLKKPDSAISKLLPLVFETYASNEKVIEELRLLLKPMKNLKARLQESLQNMYKREFKRGDDTYQVHLFKFLGTEVTVPEKTISIEEYLNEEEVDAKTFNKEVAISKIEKTPFYKMIVVLDSAETAK